MHLSLPVTMCFKNGIFSLCLENHVWKYSQVVIFGLCGTQTSKQLASSDWYKWFPMLDLSIGYLSHKIMLIMLIILNECLNLISINFNWSPKSWSSKKSPGQNFTNHFWYSQFIVVTSPYTVQFILCVCMFQLYFIFLEIIKHNMPKMSLLPYSILKWLHKNSQILIFFNAHWYGSS